jgi:hypothetical protein
MQKPAKRHWTSIGGLCLVLIGSVAIFYFLSMSESAKLVLLGSVCLAGGVFARRVLKQDTSTAVISEPSVRIDP